jgi:hypothetical protein
MKCPLPKGIRLSNPLSYLHLSRYPASLRGTPIVLSCLLYTPVVGISNGQRFFQGGLILRPPCVRGVHYRHPFG